MSDVEEKDKSKQKLKIWGNVTTMNLPQVLLTHIQSFQYFKNL
jgi:hypothetical protein